MTGISFIQDLAIIMMVAGVAGWLFQRFGLPVIVGYLIAGMLVGPASGFFPLIEDAENIQTLSQVGLIFLMFSIGMNLSIRRLRRLGISVLIAAGIGALIVFNTTRLIAVLFGMTEVQGLFLAATLIVSSSVVISKILYDLGVAHRRSGQLALGFTALEDVISILVLTFLIAYVGVGETALPVLETFGLFGAFVIFLVISGLLLVPRYLRLLARKASMESQTLLVAALLFSLALLSHHLGYSLMLGAFLLGVIVAETPERGQVDRSFLGLRHLFGTVFFVAVGMMIDIRSLLEIWPLILLISALTIAGRFFFTSFSLMLVGNPTRDAVRAGLTLTPLGEFSFVIAQAGITAAVLPHEFYRLIVGVSVVTILVCPFLIRHSGRISRYFQSIEPKAVTSGISVYHRFLTRMGSLGAGSRFWTISRRRFIQIGFGIAFITGLLLVGNPVYSRLTAAMGQDWFFPYGTAILFWAGMGIFVLIPLLAVWRNISAMAMIYAQMTSRGRERDAVAPFLIENGIKFVSGLGLALWIASFLPFGATGIWSLLFVFSLLLIALLLFRRNIVRIHSHFEIELEELLDKEHLEAKELSPWLNKYRDWELNIYEFAVPDYSSSAGQKIGELALRQTLGCSIIAIDRQGFFIGNPGPETILFPRDRLLLLGNEDQIAAARELLSTEPTATAEVAIDEVQMEMVRVSSKSPRLEKSLAELDIARKTGVQIAAIKRRGEPRVNPAANVRLKAQDELLVVGTADQVREFQRWLEPEHLVDVKEKKVQFED